MQHGDGDDVGALLDSLRAGWKRLRALGWFKRAVRGGVGAIEISVPEEDDHNGAHPHIHALLDCRWLIVSGTMPNGPAGTPQFKRRVAQIQAEIAAQWALCLRREKGGVFTRRAKPGTVHEVLKYAVSTGALLDSSIPLGDLIHALKGRKSVMPFGSIRKALKIVRAEKKAAEPPLICECGAEEWRLDPMALIATNTLTGQWLRRPGGYIRFVKWGDREID